MKRGRRTLRNVKLMILKWLAVDGNWGIWGPWASCSKSCGGGKQHRERKCDDPTPAHGGTNCTGDTMQLDDCNDILCPLPSSGQYVQVSDTCSFHMTETLQKCC